MKAIDLRPLERFTLRMVRDGKGIITWYQVEMLLPVTELPNEEGNAVRILKRLEEQGLIKAVNPQDPGSKHKFLITDVGKNLLADLGM